MNGLQGTTIGFVGLGLMGRPMCGNLLAAGAGLVVYNRARRVAEEFATEYARITVAASPADVARAAKTVIVDVADSKAAEAVILGDGGVIEGVSAGSLVIDMGTTGVPETKRFAEALAAKGGIFVDAPVSGGTPGAEAGTLAIMAGGEEDAVMRAKPIFDVLGARLTHVGGVGAGQVAKAANQVIVGLTIGAVAEALALAVRAGVDPAKVRRALQGGFADSPILQNHGKRMIEGDFEPGGKCFTQRKDMDQAMELAADLGLELPATALNRDLYDKLIAAGGGELDHAALIKAIDHENF
jgi:3-hydroxyisobutyrate dehydrogenase-like beta-hydroxyacid dehydrogenase